MLYASSRRNVVFLAREEGVEEAKRIEIGAPDEIGEERLREELAPSAATASGGNGDGDEAGPGSGAGARPGFARPKRPGKR